MSVPVSTPHLSPATLLSRDGPELTVLDVHRETGVRECTLVGHGKTALAELLSRVDPSSGDHVLLPALITDGVVGAVEAAGFEARFYRVRPDLGANARDLRGQADEDTVTIVAVHYFGFEQPSVEEIRAVAHEVDAYLISDNAHSPTSRNANGPLAAEGDAGFTSLHKQFPVPDGAILTVSHPALAAETARTLADGGDPASGRTGLTPYSLGEAAFCVESMARFVGERARRLGSVGSPIDGLGRPARTDGGTRSADAGAEASRPAPIERYRSADADCSRLTEHLLDRIDPGVVVDARRRNYRFWLDSLRPSETPEAIYTDLPAGVCPQVFPVLVEDPDSFCSAIPGGLAPSMTWPPLPDRIEDDESFPVANHLANRLVRLPVHQGLTVRDLAPAVAAVQRYRPRPADDGHRTPSV